jgi:NAD-dependent dihydropyrimidine dehydrogenase PreA subunit
MAELVYLRNVVTLVLDEQRCIGCGMCLAVCPHAVFAMAHGRVRMNDRDACMECGACVRNCPAEAIAVQAGVGCAAAVINAALGRQSSSCCCIVEPRESREGQGEDFKKNGRLTCG